MEFVFSTTKNYESTKRSSLKKISNQFYEVQEAIYKTVEISMVAIDAPKTAILPDLEYIKNLKKEYKNPYYFKFLPEKDINVFTLNRTGESVLESYAKWAEFSNDNWKGILARVEYYKSNTSWKKHDIFKELFKVANTYDVNEEVVNKVQAIIENSFNDYNKQRKERDRKYIVMIQEYNEQLDDYIEINRPMLDVSGKAVRALVNNDDIRTLMTKTMSFRAERIALQVASKSLELGVNLDTSGVQEFNSIALSGQYYNARTPRAGEANQSINSNGESSNGWTNNPSR